MKRKQCNPFFRKKCLPRNGLSGITIEFLLPAFAKQLKVGRKNTEEYLLYVNVEHASVLSIGSVIAYVLC